LSSTKIVVIVLILIGVLFVVFVARGALRNEPGRKVDNTTAKQAPRPGWTETIKGLFSSLQPKLTLKQKVYNGQSEPEKIPPDQDHPFRTVTFIKRQGRPVVVYQDLTPLEKGSPMKKMDNPQKCELPDNDSPDKDRCSIVALKDGGTLTFACQDTNPCQVAVE
jgi:hypothetical protein